MNEILRLVKIKVFFYYRLIVVLEIRQPWILSTFVSFDRSDENIYNEKSIENVAIQ